MEIFRKSRAPLKSEKFFIVRIHGQINISPVATQRLTKYPFVQMVAK